ncbi:hypothetical protein CEXT_486711 [Caerostris extrusa]|uniref:Uncharacterized protein n=1 Tax=Caerostris extrusa TaxID=172846 RepID=A0AAV4PL61_CAEEX|nr:hypothetical protein CEXT_486711 [Caerostris extrusa]
MKRVDKCPMTKCRITWLLEQFSFCQELKYSKISILEDSSLFPVKNLSEWHLLLMLHRYPDVVSTSLMSDIESL